MQEAHLDADASEASSPLRGGGGVSEASAVSPLNSPLARARTQERTPGVGARSLYLLYWYKSIKTDAACLDGAASSAPRLSAPPPPPPAPLSRLSPPPPAPPTTYADFC
jgi:hypothetical protein